jgi:predicted amidohydrolase
MIRRTVRVAAYQAPLLPSGAIDTALALVRERVRSCERDGVEILCCPEAMLGGLADYAEQPIALAIDAKRGQLEDVLAPLASETVTTIVGFTEIEGAALYNSAAVFDRGAVVGVYRKHHPAIHRSVYSAGGGSPVFTIGELTFGIVICRDSCFDEPVCTMIKRGATAIFLPTNNALPPAKGGSRLVDEANTTDAARARTDGVFVIRADVAGRDGPLISYGSSGIVDPDGRVLQSARSLEPGLLVAEVGVTARSA